MNTDDLVSHPRPKAVSLSFKRDTRIHGTIIMGLGKVTFRKFNEQFSKLGNMIFYQTKPLSCIIVLQCKNVS